MRGDFFVDKYRLLRLIIHIVKSDHKNHCSPDDFCEICTLKNNIISYGTKYF
jgi:hypothetical protein